LIRSVIYFGFRRKSRIVSMKLLSALGETACLAASRTYKSQITPPWNDGAFPMGLAASHGSVPDGRSSVVKLP
jgi:hypothetical protein